MNGAQILIYLLQKFGIKEMFTLSGGHIAPIYVEAEKNDIRVTDVRNEASAVFAADALARMSGTPGLAVVTAGPGVTNSITALKNAQLAQSPLILIGGATATLLKGRGALQDIDQMALVKPHVKWAKRITSLKEIVPVIQKAFNQVQEGVPGPVFIEFPVDLLYEETLVRSLYEKNKTSGKSFKGKIINWYIERHLSKLFNGKNEISFNNIKAVKPYFRFHDSTLRKALSLIEQAQRPLLIVGSGALLLPKCSSKLSSAILKLNIPVYLSGMARGLLGDTSKLQFYHQRRNALKEADLVILAGVPCDFRLNYGKGFRHDAKLITINRNLEETKKNISADLIVHTDPSKFLIALAESYGEMQKDLKHWKNILLKREDEREKEIATIAKLPGTSINPVALFKQLNQKLPINSTIIVDGGDFAATASYTLRPRAPLQWLDPGVFGTLGVGGGFALGAARNYPEHYLWIIYGDGSAAYSLTEFDTFRKFGLKVCAIIGNNGSWEQIAREQIPLLGKDTASVLPKSDYHLIAEAFGGKGKRVENLNDFNSSIDEAVSFLDQGIPFLINAVIGSTDFRKGSISM